MMLISQWKIWLKLSFIVLVLLCYCLEQNGYLVTSFKLTTTNTFFSKHNYLQRSILHASTSSDETYWYEYNNGESLVLYPKNNPPKAILHFVGGFISGSSIQVSYSTLLASLAAQDYLVVATPIPWINTNHDEVARKVSIAFAQCYREQVLPSIEGFGPKERSRSKTFNSGGDGFGKTIPIIGLSHSLGGKLTAIINSTPAYRNLAPRKQANIFLAFNNYGLAQTLRDNNDKQGQRTGTGGATGSNAMGEVSGILSGIAKGVVSSIDAFTNAFADGNDNDNLGYNDYNRNNNVFQDQRELLDDMKRFVANAIPGEEKVLEFNPTPTALWKMLQTDYNIPQSYFYKFQDDSIDQSDIATQYVRTHGQYAEVRVVSGNHLTPNLLLPPALSAFLQQVKSFDGIDYSSLNFASTTEQEGVIFLTNLIQLLDRITSQSSTRGLLTGSSSASKTASKWDTDNM